MKIAVYKGEDGLFCAATATRTLCERVTRAACKSAILHSIEGISPEEIEAYLDQPVSAAVYRTFWASSVTATLTMLSSVVERLPDGEVTDELSEAIAEVREQLKAIAAEIESDRRKARIKELQEQLQAMFANSRNQIAADGMYAPDSEIWSYVNQSPLAQELAELRREAVNA